MSTTLGCMYVSPSKLRPCTSRAPIVASDSASWRDRRSTPRPRTKRPLIRRPTQTPMLERSSAAVPAAREVIQNRCGPVLAASRVLIGPACAGGLGSGLEEAESFLRGGDGVDELV